MRSMTKVISMESVVLLVICMADMFSTLILVSMGYASEQNPLMAACLKQGSLVFIMAKSASFLPFIVSIEWYRRRKPAFARSATRVAIFLYVLTYIIFTIRTNMA